MGYRAHYVVWRKHQVQFTVFAYCENSHSFETNTGLFHIEWVCQVMDEAEDPEPEPTPTPEPEEEPEEGDG